MLADLGVSPTHESLLVLSLGGPFLGFSCTPKLVRTPRKTVDSRDRPNYIPQPYIGDPPSRERSPEKLHQELLVALGEHLHARTVSLLASAKVICIHMVRTTNIYIYTHTHRVHGSGKSSSTQNQ